MFRQTRDKSLSANVCLSDNEKNKIEEEPLDTHVSRGDQNKGIISLWIFVA